METYLNPFIMEINASNVERHGAVDLYPPEAHEPRPAIVIVHGGPQPAEVTPRPRDWPLFRGYGSMAAAAGVMGAVVEHRLHTPFDFPLAASDVAQTIEAVRADPRTDPGVQAFVDAAEAANAQLEIIEVPNGQHGFDYLDPTAESRDAIEVALGTVLASLN